MIHAPAQQLYTSFPFSPTITTRVKYNVLYPLSWLSNRSFLSQTKNVVIPDAWRRVVVVRDLSERCR